MRKFWISVFAALAIAGYAQGPWTKKDWKQWSKEDCRKLLEDSPWAQSWNQSSVKMANFATGTAGAQGVGSERELNLSYVVQLRSALPVREAVVRQALIASKYDRMEPAQKAALLKQTESYLNRNYDDVIVVHVVYGSNVPEYNRDLAAFWQGHYAEGAVPQDALLHGSRGEKAAPVKLISPKGGAQEFELIFPRIVEGKPLLEPGENTMSLEFVAPRIGSVDSSRLFVEFKADKMLFNGQLVY